MIEEMNDDAFIGNFRGLKKRLERRLASSGMGLDVPERGLGESERTEGGPKRAKRASMVLEFLITQICGCPDRRKSLCSITRVIV